MLNPVHLQTLQAVLRTGSLSAAGKELGYTTSAVSQQVKSLERSLGVTLFERGPATLTATYAAWQLGEAAAAVLADLERVEYDLHQVFRGDRGQLRISAFGSVAAQVLPRAVRELVAAFGAAQFIVTEEDDPVAATRAVLAAQVDVALVCAYDVVPVGWPEELVVDEILDEEIVVLSGEGADGLSDRVALTDLAAEVWVSGHPDSAEHANLTHWCAHAGFVPDVRLRSDDFDVLRGFVRENLGLALAPVLAFGTDRSIRMHRLADCRPRRKVHALSRATDPNPLLPEALRAITDAVAEFRDWTTTAFAIDTTHDPLVITPS